MSTIKVTNIDPPSAGGAVNVNGVAMPNAGPLSNRNLVINGAMQVAQRGTSATVSGFGTVDRFRTAYTGGTITQTQEDLASTDDPFGLGFRKFYRLTNTAGISNTTNNTRRFMIRLEDQDVATSGWDYTNSNSEITLSMWVRSSVAQTFHWMAQTVAGTQQRYTWDVTLAANTWTKITKTFPGNANITFDNDNSLGIIFDCAMYYGTDFTDSGVTNNAWAAYAGGTRTQDFDDSWATTTDATFDVTGIQLEVGSQATPFEHRFYGDELARCQRYYYRVADGNAQTFGLGVNYTSSYMMCAITFPVTMRAVPTLNAASGTNYYEFIRNGAADSFNSLSMNTRTTIHIGEIYNSSQISGTVGHGGWVRSANAAVFVDFDAEL